MPALMRAKKENTLIVLLIQVGIIAQALSEAGHANMSQISIWCAYIIIMTLP